MLVDAMDMIREHIRDPEMRAEFGAEGLRLRFALALLDARESTGMTQSELAAMCGVSQAYISKLESGEANPTIGKIGAIFAAMWMGPTVGFEPLLPESSKTIPSEAEARQPESRAPAAPPAAPTGLTGAAGAQPRVKQAPTSTVPIES